MFQIMHGPRGSPKRMWYPVDANGRSYDTLYVGQIVKAGSDGVLPLGSASGTFDTGAEVTPFGVVIGTNLRTPSFSSTSNSDSITSVDPHSTTTEFAGGNGPYAVRGDKIALVEVALIYLDTELKGDIRNGGISTAITVGTVTTASGTGAGFTCSGGLCNFTPIADKCSVYCRTGGNMGIYRNTTDTDTTIKTVDQYFPYDIAAGDTFVSVPLPVCGLGYPQTDTEALYLNAGSGPATNYWGVYVTELNLAESGKEYAIFYFAADHWVHTRS